MVKSNKARMIGSGIIFLIVLAGCSIGPIVLKGNRSQYNQSVQQSNNEQMLMNIVRLKYLEPPFFMQVGAISSSFNYGLGDTGASALIPEHSLHTYELQFLFQYAERPVITLTPLEGEDYVTRVLTEIDLERFVMLYRAGWNLEPLMRTLVERIGNLENNPVRKVVPGHGENTYDRFIEMSRILGEMQNRGDLEFIKASGEDLVLAETLSPREVNVSNVMAADKAGYHFQKDKGNQFELRKSGPVYFAMQLRYSDAKEAERVETLLGIEPKRKIHKDGRSVAMFKLTNTSDLMRDFATGGDLPEVPIQLRSFIDMLYYLSESVQVPEDHMEKGFVETYNTPEGKSVDLRAFTKDLLDIKSSISRPSDAYVAIDYRGNWFYITDSDIRSKGVFGLVNTLFSLQSGNIQGTQPVVTIPVGTQ